jgi:hypothetical protein
VGSVENSRVISGNYRIGFKFTSTGLGSSQIQTRQDCPLVASLSSIDLSQEYGPKAFK